MSLQWTYLLLYIGCALLIIIAVGSHLFKHGSPFLKELFPDAGLHHYINKLLLTGYYLLNIGFAVYKLAGQNEMDRWVTLIHSLSQSIGLLCLILGSIHFGNLIILFFLSKSNT
jgi:hypothetical protein